MKLDSDPYNKIATKAKVIESRLFDEKRQKISVGDTIIFNENQNPDNKLTVSVVGLTRYKSFKELFVDYEPELFGEKNREFLLNQIKKFYSDEEERKWGVVAIQLKIVD